MINEIVLVGIIYTQGVSIGQFNTTYEVVKHFKTMKVCQQELSKIKKQDTFTEYVCVQVSRD